MIYWVVLAIAIIVIFVSTIMSIRAIITERAENKRNAHKKERNVERHEDRVKDNPKKKKPQREMADFDMKSAETVKQKKHVEETPRRWKIVLEDMGSGDVYNYIFYNAVGIGRTTQEVSFEKFMSIPDDKRISKVHCSITMIDDGLYIKDEGSKNHTYLNGKKIQKPVLLQKEDVISIGETDLEVVKIFREAGKK